MASRWILIVVLGLIVRATFADELPSLSAARRVGPIQIDGRLDEAGWAAAEVGDGFRQNQPDEGAAASAATRFRILWDDEALYVGIECDEPEEPSAVLGRRDHPVDADSVSILLDTQLDRRTGYRFTVFAAGQQLDGVQYDDIQLSTDWDASWDSAVARTAAGWSVEMKIPLRHLRVPDGASELGVNVIRERASRHEESIWRFVPRGTPGLMSQLGRLRGVAGIRPVRTVELRPYLATSLSHDTRAGGTASGNLGACSSVGVATGTALRGCVGGDFKIGLTSDLVLVGAVNPDFGQVEADQRVLNLTTFETFFPEKRPFFLEGLDLFQPPVRMTDWGGQYGGDALQLFYSRRIGTALPPPALGEGETLVYQPAARPILGALKLVGQLGPVTVAALSTLETAADAEIRQADGSLRTERVADLAHSAAVRARLPLGENGFAGVTATAYDPLDSPGARHAYAGAADLTLFDDARDWSLAAQVAGSHLVGGGDALKLDGNVLGDGATGGAFSARLAKDGGWLTGFVDVDWLSPQLDVDQLGFLRRANLARGFAAVAFHDLHPSDLWQKAQLTLSTREIRTADLDFTLYRDIVIEPQVTLGSFWNLSGDLVIVPTRGDDRELGDGTPFVQRGGWGLVGNLETDTSRAAAGTLSAAIMRFGPGTQLEIDATATLRPTQAIEAQLEVDYTTTRDELRLLRGATTVEDAMPLDPGSATRSQRLYLLAPQSAQGVSVVARGTWALSPHLTLQLYAQLFTAGITYGDPVRAVLGPGRTPIVGADLAPARPEDQAPSVDDRQAALDVNLILRWEWRTGSTLYLVYGHDTTGLRSLGPGVGLSFSDELATLVKNGSGSVDTFLLKIDFLSAL